ncbi:hypothetical protein [Paenibacillus chitinolyticus]|uniref:hypothetical protein n=1 Tax=Paenibacillus chitinolyticus TaxID=79263 RepID=UPI00366ECE8A
MFLEDIIKFANENEIIYFINELDPDEIERVNISISSSEENFLKLFLLAKKGNYPVFITESKLTMDEVQSSLISYEDLIKNHLYKTSSNEVKLKITNIVDEYNKVIEDIPVDVTYKVSVVVILSTYYMSIDHFLNDEGAIWDSQLFYSLDELIEEKFGIEEINKLEQNRVIYAEEITQKVQGKWIEHLRNDDEFRGCTNRDLRLAYLSKQWLRFKQTLSDEEKEINSVHPQIVMEQVWKEIKESLSISRIKNK